MARLIYSAISSLDGYVEDETGAFDWSMPDDEVFAFLNDRERAIRTHLYGRRMYEVMSYWETAPTDETQSEPERDFTRIWRAADKVVYSRTLDAPTTARTRVERTFDPAEVRRLKESSPTDLSIGGAEIAGQALVHGLVDECQVYLNPIAVGGGRPVFPHGVRVGLELVDERRFAGGVVWLRYTVGPPTA